LLVELRRGLTAARGTAAAGASEGGALELQVDRVAGQLWDDWMQAKLAACCDALELAHRRAGLCGEPLRRRLDEVAVPWERRWRSIFCAIACAPPWRGRARV
jgi:hypothetical protein